MRVPLPAKGQPLDITYISTLADTVNKLADDVFVDGLVSWGYNGKLQTASSRLGLDCGKIHVVKSATRTSITAPFQITYLEVPIVVVSLAGEGGMTDGGLNHVSVTKRTTGSVTFAVDFSPPMSKIDLHWIAMGLTR